MISCKPSNDGMDVLTSTMIYWSLSVLAFLDCKLRFLVAALFRGLEIQVGLTSRTNVTIKVLADAKYLEDETYLIGHLN